MRMLVIGHGSQEPAGAVVQQMVESLRFLGHEVVVVDAVGDRGADAQRVRNGLERFAPDVLIQIPTTGSLDATLVRELTARTDTVAVAIHRGPTCTGAPTDLDRVGEDLRDYDLVTVPDASTLADFAAEGTFRLSLLQPAVHVPAFDAVVASERRGLVVAGPADPANIDLVAALDGLDHVTTLGSGWDGLPLDIDTAMGLDPSSRGTLLAGASLVVELPCSLGHQTSTGRHPRELGLSDLVLEAAAVGTPAVVLDRPGVSELLEPGSEVLSCETATDLAALVPMLLASPDELALVGDAAWHRVTSEHTWANRWESLFGPWVDPHESDEGEDVRLIAPAEEESATVSG